MTTVEALLGSPFAQALGWALIHFLWQGALIALLYLIASVLIRRLNSNVRYAAVCCAMLLMLIAPVVTMLARYRSAQQTEAVAVELTNVQPVADASQLANDRMVGSTRQAAESVPPLSATSVRQWTSARLPQLIPWLLAVWLAGVLFLSLRFAGGLMMVRRLKRAGGSAALSTLQDKAALLCRRLRISRIVRLCESALVEVPTVIGWLRPVVLIPATALTGLSPEQLEALLAHELAHIRRHDYLVNLMQTTIETLLFYHPAVWWISAQIRQEREHCCDDLAVAACGDVLAYARALTALEQMRATEPQLLVAANGGSLLIRIQRLLRGRAPAMYGSESWLVGFAAIVAVAIVLAGSQTALIARNAQAAIKQSLAPESSTSSPAKVAQSAKLEKPVEPVARAIPPEPAADPTPAAPADDPAQSQARPDDSKDYASEMAAAGLANLSVEDLISLKNQGITTEFVREMSALVPDKLTADDLVAMKIHGVTSSYANEMKALGLRLNADELVAFKIHGVTAQFINEMKNAGLNTADADALVSFKIHGVTPAFVQQMKDFGFDGLSGDDLTAFRIHGITPLYVQTMKTYIHGPLRADDLVALRIHGVTPEIIKEFELAGFANLSADDLTAFGIHGITPAFIKSVQVAGYPKATAEQITELKIHGVTPEFIRDVKSRGFTDVTLDQLVELRRMNLLPSRKKPN